MKSFNTARARSEGRFRVTISGDGHGSRRHRGFVARRVAVEVDDPRGVPRMGDEIHALSITAERVRSDIRRDTVVLYMNETPVLPRCGFFVAAVQILDDLGSLQGGATCRPNPACARGSRNSPIGRPFPSFMSAAATSCARWRRRGNSSCCFVIRACRSRFDPGATSRFRRAFLAKTGDRRREHRDHAGPLYSLYQRTKRAKPSSMPILGLNPKSRRLSSMSAKVARTSPGCIGSN